jgi:serine phosphatase RsbU (regulator of sigma subunit)/PAS domain-containing protein
VSLDPSWLESEIAGLAARCEELRQAAALPGAELQPVLAATCAELAGATNSLAAVLNQARREPSDDPRSGRLHAERRLLHAMFQDAPVPMFLLGSDGTVRRANRRAGELLGFRPGYATGKLFTAFVDLPSRAAVQTQIAAALRNGEPRQIHCGLLSAEGSLDGKVLDIVRVNPEGEARQLLVTATERAPTPGYTAGRKAAGPAAKPGQPKQQESPRQARQPGHGEDAAGTLQAMTGRLDLMSAVARLLLENATFSESVMLQRCARLLADRLAVWVIVDMGREGRLQRQYVAGPQDKRSAGLVGWVAAIDPQPDSVPWQVHESGSSFLTAHAEDTGLLGAGPQGIPLLLSLGATSVLCVPLSDGERSYGVLTLARPAGDPPFGLAELGLAEEVGEELALAVTVDRMFRQRSEIADALQASLIPHDLPDIPGVEVAAVHVATTESQEAGGDFYDVHRSPDGWGIAIGDVCGKGKNAAAVTAAARHAIRVIAHWDPDPAEVLRKANEIMLAEKFGGRFVTAEMANVQWNGRTLHVVLGSAGHPGPLLVTPDGRVRVVSGGGLPLGIFPDAGPAVHELNLARGDVLFFCTDGVTGARGPGLTDFEDHLTDELAALAGKSPAEIVSRMQKTVLEFCGGRPHDDMTMLVLRAGDPPTS